MTVGDLGMRLRRLICIFKDYPVYYVTINSHHRKRILADSAIHTAFITFAERALNYDIAVGRYVLMPDHIHLFAAFGPKSLNISLWVKSLKNALSKCLRQRGIPAPHWQKGYFDHLLRNEESCDRKWEYVRLNPVRAALVTAAEDWEFQGEICQLERPAEE